MLQQGADNFLACKKPIDAMWRCYTQGKYGDSIRDAPAYAKPYEAKFYDCMFRDATGLDVCMGNFSNMVNSWGKAVKKLGKIRGKVGKKLG